MWDCIWDIKSINTTTIIRTDVPPIDMVGDMPAKFIKASGNKHIKVKYIAPKTVSLAKTESI